MYGAKAVFLNATVSYGNNRFEKTFEDIYVDDAVAVVKYEPKAVFLNATVSYGNNRFENALDDT